jgi:hypothetical protein
MEENGYFQVITLIRVIGNERITKNTIQYQNDNIGLINKTKL